MIDRNQKQPLRYGAIASFPTLAALDSGFDRVAEIIPVWDPVEHRQRYSGDTEPPNVLNYALRIFDPKDDMTEEQWHEKLLELINGRTQILQQRGVRRLSVLICRPSLYPLYFTLRQMNGTWDEESAIRHIEPALAFQLELSRLSHYKLSPVFTESKQLHI